MYTYKNSNTKRWQLSIHAQIRMSQRNISAADLAFVLDYGVYVDVRDGIAIYLRTKDIPRKRRGDSRANHLVGTTIVMSRDFETIITVWRNRRNGMHYLKRLDNKIVYQDWHAGQSKN